MQLILLILLGWISSVLANGEMREKLSVKENALTTASVLPYILKRPDKEENSKREQEQQTKRYTFLTAATSSKNLLKNENSIEEAEDNNAPDNVALAKTDYAHSWQHGPFFNEHNGHNNGGYDLWNDVYKFAYTIIGAVNNGRPSYGYGAGPTAANAPLTLLILLNLGLLSFTMLSIVGSLVHSLNTAAGFNPATYSNTRPYHHNVGLGQYGFWRTADMDLMDNKPRQA